MDQLIQDPLRQLQMIAKDHPLKQSLGYSVMEEVIESHDQSILDHLVLDHSTWISELKMLQEEVKVLCVQVPW